MSTPWAVYKPYKFLLNEASVPFIVKIVYLTAASLEAVVDSGSEVTMESSTASE